MRGISWTISSCSHDWNPETLLRHIYFLLRVLSFTDDKSTWGQSDYLRKKILIPVQSSTSVFLLWILFIPATFIIHSLSCFHHDTQTSQPFMSHRAIHFTHISPFHHSWYITHSISWFKLEETNFFNLVTFLCKASASTHLASLFSFYESSASRFRLSVYFCRCCVFLSTIVLTAS